MTNKEAINQLQKFKERYNLGLAYEEDLDKDLEAIDIAIGSLEREFVFKIKPKPDYEIEINKAYNQGYDDGCDAGYDTGYEFGCADMEKYS